MAEQMTVKVRINKKGVVTTDVVDRGAHHCTEVYQLTSRVGKQLSDTETGPDCDQQNEVQR